MSTQPPLIVPVQVDALLVNRRVRENETFRRWYADFGRLDDRYPPEPDPFGSAASGKPALGIHLQWLLPDALRRGRQDGPAGQVEFPYVPNRWLVVRYSRPKDQPAREPDAVGWIVDSDFLDEDDGESEFLDPWEPGLKPTLIGRVHELADGAWEEPAGRQPFLTAAGPGLPTFSMFQPYNESVFSMHDPLDGVDSPSALSYTVIGWYSDPNWDILSAPPDGDVRALLDSLRWSTTATTFRPARSFYAGSALHLPWDIDGAPPPSDKPELDDTPDAPRVEVAVGHIATDAETALHPAALGDPEAALLWEAFSYDLLDILDEDGESALDEATRRTWFGAEPGGYTWRIIDRPAPAEGAAWPGRTPQQIAEERQWLDELNAAQAEYDAASRELAGLQRRLYGLWWLRGRTSRPAGWDARCDAQLRESDEGTVAWKVRQQLNALYEEDGLRDRIPLGDTPEELASAIEDYTREHHLAPGRELQRVAEPTFHRTPDPSVIVRGAKLDRPLTSEDALPCRTSAETVTEIRIGDEMTSPPDAPPAPELTGLPERALLNALLAEFYLLDRAAVTPGSAPDTTALDDALADPVNNVTGTLDRWTRPWRQPWSPLLLIWKTACYRTPYQTNGVDHWRFDGTGYRWEGSGAADARTLTGRALLNPLPGFNSRARLAQHAATHPRGPVGKLLDLRRQAGEWDLLSQRIDGINEWLAQQTTSTNLAPAGPLGELTDTSLSRVSLSEVPEPGPASGTDTEFQPVRGAQLAFEQLHVIDRFGRSLAIISPDNAPSFPVRRADSVTPEIPVRPENPYRFVELPPRLLQPARLRFDFVSARDDHHRIDADAGPAEAAGETPVCGWLVVNRLNHSLLVHAPDGQGLGEIRIVLDTRHQQVTDWYPLPDSPYPDLTEGSPTEEEFATALPHLHGFVTQLLRGGETAFTELLAALDCSLSTTAPGGDDDSIAALAGRPVALLRARLRFELDGPPLTSSAWNDVVKPPESDEPEFIDYLWNVRLGAGDMLSDGLAGFFVGRAYGRLHTVAEPEADSPEYVAPIDGHEIALPVRPAPSRTHDADAPAAWVTLLADPWAAVHAVTDILPVGRLLLPPTWVREPLGRIKLSFRMGPLLAGTRLVPGAEDEPPVEHVVMPGPSGWRGTWEWVEPARVAKAGPTDWDTRPLTPPDSVLDLTDTTPAARTGFLQLADALGDSGTTQHRRPPAEGPGSTSR
ncbi:hypothetical protein ACWGCW_13625 [Streptomyces sp. NPDC054933]